MLERTYLIISWKANSLLMPVIVYVRTVLHKGLVVGNSLGLDSCGAQPGFFAFMSYPVELENGLRG